MTGAIDAAVARSATVDEVMIGAGVMVQAGALFRRRFGDGPACIIADDASWAAAGPALEQALQGIPLRRHILPARPRPKPTVELADTLRDILATDGATPVALGSGVINDVVKHAAFSLGRRYMCVATAASMDGYTSAGAPLAERGFKKTIQCRPASVILADLDILAAAPPAMTGWGYGDLAGKVPAGADWIIADALGIEAIDDVAWPMVQHDLRRWLSDPARIARGDRGAIEGLFSGLTMVGLAMEAHGSSRPASGADHQIAHLWEMEDLHFQGERVSHGACVAVGCVATLALYDWLLAQDLTRIDPAAVAAAAPGLEAKKAAILLAFGAGEIAARSAEETAAKHAARPALQARLTRLQSIWPDLRVRLQGHLVTASAMRAALHAAGAPADPHEIGLTPARLRQTVLAARFLRSRYTLLDVLDETGLLPQAVAEALPDRAEAPRKEAKG
jgi:glycerol-1-phosphate dehydrogenase [NAD(P)+]